MFSTGLKDIPKSPETATNTDNNDQVPHDESASEKSVSDKSVSGKSPSETSSSVTDSSCHKIVLDRNVSIKVGKFLQFRFDSSTKQHFQQRFPVFISVFYDYYTLIIIIYFSFNIIVPQN